jgi:hypothetical protein
MVNLAGFTSIDRFLDQFCISFLVFATGFQLLIDLTVRDIRESVQFTVINCDFHFQGTWIPGHLLDRFARHRCTIRKLRDFGEYGA